MQKNDSSDATCRITNIKMKKNKNIKNATNINNIKKEGKY